MELVQELHNSLSGKFSFPAVLAFNYKMLTCVGTERLVNVDEDTWIASAVCAREFDGGRLGRA